MATPVIPTELRVMYDFVYEPAEDSFLMLDALESEIEGIKDIEPSICLEIGCGSGIVISFLAMQLGPRALYMCTDVNKDAIKATSVMASANKVAVEPVLTDLATSLTPRLRNKIDVLLFNPPYVETPDEEVGGMQITASWAGGNRGRRVTDRLLAHVNNLLSPKGRFYLLTLDVNDIDEISEILKRDNIHKRTIVTRKCGREKLTVTCFTRIHS